MTTTTALTTGSAVVGTCRCHRCPISGIVEREELTRLTGRPVRMLYVRTSPSSANLHELPAGNAH